MTSKIKEFSKGQAVTVETGGKPQAEENKLEKAADAKIAKEIKDLKDTSRE